MKKIISSFVCFCCLISFLLVDVKALIEDDFTYGVIDDEVIIYHYLGTDTNIVIPEEINGMLVTMIDDAFDGYDIEFEPLIFDSLTLSKNIKQICGTYTNDWDNYIYAPFGFAYVREFIVDKDNSYFASYNGAIYSKDYTYLYRVPDYQSTIDLHPELEIIDKWAFIEREVEVINLSKKVKQIGEIVYDKYFDALTDTSMLKEINVEEGNERYFSIDGVLYEKYNNEITLLAYPSAKETTRLTIMDGTTKILADSFSGGNTSGFTNIQEILIPESVTEIIDISSYSSNYIGQYNLLVYEGSYAHNYAIERGLNYRLVNDILLGDVNGDGKITFNDAVMILQFDSKILTLTDAQKAAADINGDGSINYSDAVIILQKDAGLIKDS